MSRLLIVFIFASIINNILSLNIECPHLNIFDYTLEERRQDLLTDYAFDFNLKNDFLISSYRNNRLRNLLKSCYEGNISRIKEQVNNLNVNEVDANNTSLLHVACQQGHLEIVKYLLSFTNIAINIKDAKGLTPFHWACIQAKDDLNYSKEHKNWFSCISGASSSSEIINGEYRSSLERYLDIISLLYKANKNTVNVKDWFDNNCLHLICAAGNFKTFKYVIKKMNLDAFLCHPNNQGHIPLHAAIWKGNFKIFNYIFKNYKCINHLDHLGRNALFIACNKQRQDVFEILLNNNVYDVCNLNTYNLSIFLYAILCKNTEFINILAKRYLINFREEFMGGNILHLAAHIGDVELLETLMKLSRISILEKNFCGNTVMHIVCEFGYLNMFKYLISMKCFDLTSKNKKRDTPLSLSIKSNSTGIIKHLVEEIKMPILNDNKERDLLYLCCRHGGYYIVNYLLSKINLDTDLSNKYKILLLETALKYKHIYILSYIAEQLSIIENGQEYIYYIYFCLLVKYKSIDMIFIKSVIKPLLQKKLLIIKDDLINLYNKFDQGYNGLHLLVSNKDLNIIKYLISLNIFPLNQKTHQGDNLCHLACKAGNKDLLVYLISLNQFNILDNNTKGENLLHMASKSGNIKMFQFLMNLNIFNVHSLNRDGFNLLHKACISGNINLVKYIISLNLFKINSLTSSNLSLLHIACKHSHLNLLKYLISLNSISLDLKVRGLSLLQYAVNNNQLNIVKYLMTLDLFDINEKNTDGENLLHLASKNLHLNFTRYLHLLNQVESIYGISLNNQMLDFLFKSNNLDMFLFILKQNTKFIKDRSRFGKYPLVHLKDLLRPVLIHIYNNIEEYNDFQVSSGYITRTSNSKDVSTILLQQGVDIHNMEINNLLKKCSSATIAHHKTIEKFMFMRGIILIHLLKGDLDYIKNLKIAVNHNILSLFFSYRYITKILINKINHLNPRKINYIYNLGVISRLIYMVSQEYNLQMLYDEKKRNLLWHALNKKNYSISKLLISINKYLLSMNSGVDHFSYSNLLTFLNIFNEIDFETHFSESVS